MIITVDIGDMPQEESKKYIEKIKREMAATRKIYDIKKIRKGIERETG